MTTVRRHHEGRALPLVRALRRREERVLLNISVMLCSENLALTSKYADLRVHKHRDVRYDRNNPAVEKN